MNIENDPNPIQSFRNQFSGLPPDKSPKSPKSRRNDRQSAPFGGSGAFGEGGTDENESTSFPLDGLPATARLMVSEICKSALVPESLAAINILGILSASIGSGILIGSGGGRITSANLYLLGIAESGTGKGRGFGMAAHPFREIEAEEILHWTDTVLPGIKKDLRLIEKDFKKHDKDYEKAPDATGRDIIGKEMQELEKRKADLEKLLASEPGFSVADITKEQLAITLETQPGQALASLSPEGRGVIDVLMGKYDKRGNSDEDLYLSAYCREPVKVSRVSRPPVHLRHPCLSILWLIQPDKARKIFESEALTESGMLARFLVCDSKAEAQDEPDTPHTPHAGTLDSWAELIDGLLGTYRANGDKPSTIKPDPEARTVLTDYTNESKRRTRKGGDLHDIAPFAARWGENAWRLALVLHAAKYGQEAGTLTLEEGTARHAVQIVRWFTDEQLCILAPERSNRHRSRFVKLQTILSDHGGERSMRDLDKSNRFTREEIESLCQAFPTRIEIEVRSTGGRPSQVVKLKP